MKTQVLFSLIQENVSNSTTDTHHVVLESHVTSVQTCVLPCFELPHVIDSVFKFLQQCC
jgi:hypothetical protein